MVFGRFKRNADEAGLYPYIAKGVVNIRNVEVTSGKPLGVSREPELFRDYFRDTLIVQDFPAGMAVE